MELQKRLKLIKSLPYPHATGFVAFCMERCLAEARLHPVAQAQLERLTLLGDGLAILWARAERAIEPDPRRVAAIVESGDTFYNRKNRKNPFTVDVTLVHAYQVLLRGLSMSAGRSKNWQDVNSARQGIVQAVWYIYDDWRAAQKQELAISDAALLCLGELGTRPFSREVFGKVSEWPRGKLDADYAQGKLKRESPLDRAC